MTRDVITINGNQQFQPVEDLDGTYSIKDKYPIQFMERNGVHEFYKLKVVKGELIGGEIKDGWNNGWVVFLLNGSVVWNCNYGFFNARFTKDPIEQQERKMVTRKEFVHALIASGSLWKLQYRVRPERNNGQVFNLWCLEDVCKAHDVILKGLKQFFPLTKDEKRPDVRIEPISRVRQDCENEFGLTPGFKLTKDYVDAEIATARNEVHKVKIGFAFGKYYCCLVTEPLCEKYLWRDGQFHSGCEPYNEGCFASIGDVINVLREFVPSYQIV